MFPSSASVAQAIVLIAFWGSASTLLAQMPLIDRQIQVHEIESGTRQQLAQVDSWLKAGEFRDAIQQLSRMEDEANGRVLADPAAPLNRSFPVIRYRSLKEFIASSRSNWRWKHPEAWQEWNRGREATLQRQWAEWQNQPSIEKELAWAESNSGSSLSCTAWTHLGDLYLQRGWSQAARDCFQRADRSMRAPIELAGNHASNIPWHLVLRQFQGETVLPLATASWLKNQTQTPTDATSDQLASLWARLCWCSLVDKDDARFELERRVLAECFPEKVDPSSKTPVPWLAKVKQWKEDSKGWSLSSSSRGSSQTFAGSPFRDGVASSVKIEKLDRADWNDTLPRYLGSSDSNPAGRWRTAESMDGLLVYHPVIHDGRVYVNQVNRVVAFQLKDGKPWPVHDPTIPLFDTGIPDEALIPLGYPVIGVPRGTLTIEDQSLYARVGSPITGWKSRSGLKEGSTSSLIGLDLQAEGRLLPGFPIRLTGERWKDCEFEGSPLVVGKDLLVMITQRNNVHLRRSIASFDRWTGRFRWQSPVLAAGVPEGVDEANLISHQLLSYSEGRVFCDTGLGVIAAVSASNGDIHWLARHPQVKVANEAYPRSQRFRFRDLTPPLVYHDQVICAPSSCRELFSLDWSSGDLHWATDPDIATDAIHLLGVEDQHLIASGDRLHWIHLSTGRRSAVFPEDNAAPRGLGRGMISNHRVLWPTSGSKVLEFDGSLKEDPSGRLTAVKRREMTMGIRGAEGANFVAADGWLVLAGSNRLLAWRAQ